LFISVYCITAVGAEESCSVQPTFSVAATTVQQDVGHSHKSSEVRKKHKRKHRKRTRKTGMYRS